MAKQLMPKAELESFDSDVVLTDEQFNKIGLFAQLKRKVSLDRYPGAVRLRRFRKGDVICAQGDAGWTAFYILTSEDMVAIGQNQMEVAGAATNRAEVLARPGTLQAHEIAALRQRMSQMSSGIAGPSPVEEKLRAAATVYLSLAKATDQSRTNWLNRLAKGSEPKPAADKPVVIPIDGPVTLRSDQLRADLHEGELFGEMSCLYRTPRSATVVAKRECYMIEMLRNILDQIQKDPAYKAKADAVYKQRVLQLQLRRLPLFSDLTEPQFNELRKDIELVSFDPGQVIFDEQDRSECMYLIRSGLVKVMKNVSALLSVDDVGNWPAFCAALAEGANDATGPRGKVWQLLPETIREAAKSAGDPFRTLRDERQTITQALNDLIKNNQTADAKEFKETVESQAFKDRTRFLPEKRKDWTEPDVRRCNRILLEELYPQATIRRTRSSGPETILNYSSRGETLGEIGLITRQPRSATCVAHGQPNDCGQVELVKIPEKAFWRLVEGAPAIRERVEKTVAARKQFTLERMQVPIWDDSRQVLFSGRFEELGLIQGQKLMLIDLDRCTRCDECVKGCVNTHADGRSRLFLDGPRFGKYLVPTTCRSCLDPVCMIGCPVGSIHRGDNREITIEDWCIGCGLCSDQCPYGSIQMHDLGIIPEAARGWRFLPSGSVTQKRWYDPKQADRNWLPGQPPFLFDWDLRAALAADAERRQVPPGADQTLCFRHEFQLDAKVLRETTDFEMEVTSADPSATVWINGKEIYTDDKPKRGKRKFVIPPKVAPPVTGRRSIDENDKTPARTAPPPPAPTSSARDFLQAGRNVVAVRVSPTWVVRISDVKGGGDVLNLRGHEGPIRCIAYAPDGQRLASGSGDMTVRLWSLADGKEVASLKGHKGMVTALAFAPDGKRIITASEDKTVRVWTLDPKGAKETACLTQHQQIVTCLAWSPDGKKFASGSWDNTICIWDAQTNALAATCSKADQGKVYGVAFSADSRRLVSGADDHLVRLWDASTGAALASLPGHDGLVWSVSCAPDGRRIASGGQDGTVRIWDAQANGQEMACLRGHTGAVRCVTFSPDARRVASGSDDKTVRVWEARSGNELLCIQGQQGKGYGVAFSPDARRVASSAQTFARGDIVLDLRLDRVHKPDMPADAAEGLSDEITEKLVTHRAVVCDLCSSLPGQVPACVNACPHDAAMRVDARFEFPVK